MGCIWNGDCGRKPNVKAFIFQIYMCVCEYVAYLNLDVTKKLPQHIHNENAIHRGNNRPRHFFQALINKRWSYTQQQFNGIFMHNIIFSIRNVLPLSAVFFFFFLFFPFTIPLFSSSVSRLLHHENIFAVRYSVVVILPFIYFSHWMEECSIPNDTTKELYYLCVVHSLYNSNSISGSNCTH